MCGSVFLRLVHSPGPLPETCWRMSECAGNAISKQLIGSHFHTVRGFQFLSLVKRRYDSSYCMWFHGPVGTRKIHRDIPRWRSVCSNTILHLSKATLCNPFLKYMYWCSAGRRSNPFQMHLYLDIVVAGHSASRQHNVLQYRCLSFTLCTVCIRQTDWSTGSHCSGCGNTVTVRYHPR